MINTENLTNKQITLRVIALTKKWLKDNDYHNKIAVRYVRGTYHFDNAANYMLSAKYILEQATGLTFTALNGSMARIGEKQTKSEIFVPTVKGQYLVFQSYAANANGTDYVRFTDSSKNELLYYDSAEWAENPVSVMGAIMAAILNGAEI